MRGDRETQAVENLTARGRRVENNPKVYPCIDFEYSKREKNAKTFFFTKP